MALTWWRRARISRNKSTSICRSSASTSRSTNSAASEAVTKDNTASTVWADSAGLGAQQIAAVESQPVETLGQRPHRLLKLFGTAARGRAFAVFEGLRQCGHALFERGERITVALRSAELINFR